MIFSKFFNKNLKKENEELKRFAESLLYSIIHPEEKNVYPVENVISGLLEMMRLGYFGTEKNVLDLCNQVGKNKNQFSSNQTQFDVFYHKLKNGEISLKISFVE